MPQGRATGGGRRRGQTGTLGAERQTGTLGADRQGPSGQMSLYACWRWGGGGGCPQPAPLSRLQKVCVEDKPVRPTLGILGTGASAEGHLTQAAPRGCPAAATSGEAPEAGSGGGGEGGAGTAARRLLSGPRLPAQRGPRAETRRPRHLRRRVSEGRREGRKAGRGGSGAGRRVGRRGKGRAAAKRSAEGTPASLPASPVPGSGPLVRGPLRAASRAVGRGEVRARVLWERRAEGGVWGCSWGREVPRPAASRVFGVTAGKSRLTRPRCSPASDPAGLMLVNVGY